MTPPSYAVITNVRSGLALDLPDDIANGARIQQRAPNGTLRQQWHLILQGNTPGPSGFPGTFPYYGVAAQFTNFTVDLPNGSHQPGLYLQMYTLHLGPNQLWTFVPKPGTSNIYYIFNKGTTLCFDIPNGSTRQGEGLGEYTFHGNDNQQWRVTSS